MGKRIKTRPIYQQIALGAVAGAGATGIMQGLLAASGEETREQIPETLVNHALFGMAVVAAYDGLMRM